MAVEEKRIREDQDRIRCERDAEIKERRDKLLRLQKEEQIKVDGLLKEVDRWHQSQRIRAYVAAIEQMHTKSPDSLRSDQEKAWLKWAYDQAARIDPLAHSLPSILDWDIDDALES
jgi:hypothetical protein